MALAVNDQDINVSFYVRASHEHQPCQVDHTRLMEESCCLFFVISSVFADVHCSRSIARTHSKLADNRTITTHARFIQQDDSL